MGEQNHNFEPSGTQKLDIGSPEYQLREEYLQKLASLEKDFQDLKREFTEQFG